MALGKIKNDIKFFNPQTMEVTCTYNSCNSKFDLQFEEKIYHVPTRKSVSVTYIEQYRSCSECGNRFQSDTDKKVSLSNKTKAVNDFVLNENLNK